MTFDFPQAPADLQSRNPRRHLRYFGPGAILASVTIGTGETVLASRGGALFGYTLLWCFLLAAILKGIPTYSGLRFLTLTGYHPAVFWTRLRGPRGWLPMFMALASVGTLMGIVGALPKFLATLVAHTLGAGPSSPAYGLILNALATALLMGCALLALRSSYLFLERSQAIVVLFFLAFIVGAFLAVQPGLGTILKHFLLPSLPSYPDWASLKYPDVVRRGSWVEVMTYLGLIGGSGSDYLGYLSFVREKGWGLAGAARPADTAPDRFPRPSPEEVRRGKFWLRAPRLDVILSFGCVVAFTTVFLVLGAAILAPAELVPNDAEILTVQARFLTRLHPALFPLYVLGVFMVFLGTLYGTFEIQARALTECLHALRPQRAAWALGSLRRRLILGSIVAGLAFIWIDWSPLMVLTPASILSGVFACGLCSLAMAWVECEYLPLEFRPGPMWRALLVVGGVAMMVLGLRALYDYFLLLSR